MDKLRTGYSEGASGLVYGPFEAIVGKCSRQGCKRQTKVVKKEHLRHDCVCVSPQVL